MRWLPGLTVARTYERRWLRGDLVAALVVTALLIPQGMAYAELAGLPPVTGLYTTVVALLAYALLGPSRILVLGPDSSLGPLIAATILPLVGADGDPAKAVALAGALAILMGGVCVIAGLARLGQLAELLSMPVRVGYLNGIALVVLVSQLPKLFGFSVDADGFLPELAAWVRGVADGETNGLALAIGVACIAVILAFRRWWPVVPGVLVAVVGATIVVAVWDLADELSVVGSVPAGFPSPAIPDVSGADLGRLAAAAVGMAFVTLADSSALSRTFALRRGDRVDPNQEIVALGAANVAAGLFGGFPVSASSSRTAVADSAGAQSQLVGVVGALAIVVVLMFANDLLADLPSSALAAVVIVAGVSLFDLPAMQRLWRVRRSEFLLSLAALLGVTLVGVLAGIVIAVGLSVANLVRRQWRPYDAVLGVVSGRAGYHDLDRHPDGITVPGVVIYRFDAPLFFANADHFARQVIALVDDAEAPVRTVIVAAEPIIDIDTTGADVLGQLLSDLRRQEVTLVFAELKGPVKDRLRSYGLYDRIGDDHFFPTLEEAVGWAATQ